MCLLKASVSGGGATALPDAAWWRSAAPALAAAALPVASCAATWRADESSRPCECSSSASASVGASSEPGE